MITPVIAINGYPLPATIAGNVYRVQYKEGLVMTGDTVCLDISDPTGSFRRGFKLKAAVPVTLSIVSSGRTRVCGSFYIHTLEMRGDKSGGADIHIDCTSIPITPASTVRTERKSRASEKTTLKDLTTKAAGESGLSVTYKAADNPTIGRVDQHDESDLVHLGKHCSENDFALKIKDNAIWVLDREALEKQAPVGTIVIPSPGNPGGINGVGGITSWSLTECVEDVYKGAEVAFKDHKTGKLVVGTVTDPNASDLGPTLRDKRNPHDAESTDLNEKDTSKETTPPTPVKNNPKNLLGINLPSAAIAGSLFSTVPLATTPTVNLETNAAKKARALKVATSKLKEKNRNRHKKSIVKPYDPSLESGTVYAVSGSRSDLDGNWLVVSVTNTLSKGGNTTSAELERCLTW